MLSVSLPAAAQGQQESTAPQAPPHEGAPPPQQYAAPPPAAYVPPPDEEEDFKQFAVEANPLALSIGRYSANVQYLPSQHHALVLNPHYDSVDAELTVEAAGERVTVGESFTGGGAELGNRYYTGSKGPNGFYVGPSALLAFYSASSSDITGSDAKSFSSYGFAIDIGGQAIIGPGVVIGGGFGLQYTKVSENQNYVGDLPLSAEILVGGGVRPRFLFTVGYAW